MNSDSLELNLKKLKKEFIVGDNLLPYDYHYSENSIKTDDDTLIRIFEVEGLLFETADNSEINAWHRQLCQAFLSIGINSSNFAIWHWTIKEEDEYIGLSSFSQGFSSDFLENYANSINTSLFYTTKQFIAICIKSPFKMPRTKLATSKRLEFLEECEEKLNEVASDLKQLQHGIKPLGIYEKNGQTFSSSLEVLFRILNGYWSAVPLDNRPIKDYLATSRLLCGSDAYELRTPDIQIYGAALGFRQYPNPTDPCMLQNILRLNFPITLCQSFIYENNNKSASEVARQYRQMKLSKDAPQAYIDAMEGAIDQLKSGQIYFGHHHLNLFVYAVSDGSIAADSLRRRLTDNVSRAKQILSQVGVVVAREDLALPSAHYAQLPGNQEYRPRVARINTRNLASFIPMHTTPTGTSKSHWLTRDNRQEELLAFKSTSGGLYRFNPHINDLGHSIIIGASGSGKTVLMGTLNNQFDKYGARVIIFDKDSGQEILVRALGGKYHHVKKGEPTGLNPFSLPPTKANINFLTLFTLHLAYPDGQFTANQENELFTHLANWYANKDLPDNLRRLSELVNGLQDPDLKDRLHKWTRKGAMGWLFDNPSDHFNFMDHQYIGIDTTDILDDDRAKGPFFMYLTHRVTEALDGRRTVISLDEMWKMLDDPYFETMIKDWLKTLRKKNALVLGATQDAADIANSNISSTLLSQCQTRIFYANPLAKREDYVHFSLTDNEFNFIKEVNPKQRLLLIKQENGSVIVNFNLAGLDRHLAVISGRTKNIEIARECINQFGENPSDWLPVFYNRYVME